MTSAQPWPSARPGAVRRASHDLSPMARRVVPLTTPPAAVAALRAPLALPRAPLGPLLGAQGVAPVLGPGRGRSRAIASAHEYAVKSQFVV